MAFSSRRVFLKTSAALAAAGALAIAGDATIFEPNRPRLVEMELPLTRLPQAWDGFRIAQLSDFHYDDHFSVIPIRKAVEMVNELQPDLAVLTGDFVTSPMLSEPGIKEARSIEPCVALLAGIRARFGSMAVLGNHDIEVDPHSITDCLRAHNIQVLRNRSTPLEREGTRLWVSGVDDVLGASPDLDVTLQNVPKNEPVVLLVHEPDFAEQVAKHPVDLQLSGHSHGGQIRFPFLGAVFLPALARKFPLGLYNIGNLKLYTNPGIGTIRLPVRWNCPPEITLFTLRSHPSLKS